MDSLDFTVGVKVPRIEVKPKNRKSSPLIVHKIYVEEEKLQGNGKVRFF